MRALQFHVLILRFNVLQKQNYESTLSSMYLLSSRIVPVLSTIKPILASSLVNSEQQIMNLKYT